MKQTKLEIEQQKRINQLEKAFEEMSDIAMNTLKYAKNINSDWRDHCGDQNLFWFAVSLFITIIYTIIVSIK